MYQALILDMDGTTIDSRPAVVVSFREAAAKWDLAYGQAEIDFVMYNSAVAVAQYFARHEGFLHDLSERTRANAYLVHLFDGIADLLNSSVPLGIVTSERRQELLSHLARLGVSTDRFGAMVAVDDTPYEKPHPHPLLHCIERMGLRPEQALYVGDSLHDMHCAASAGVDFGLALWGCVEPERFDKVKFRLSHPRELLALAQ